VPYKSIDPLILLLEMCSFSRVMTSEPERKIFLMKKSQAEEVDIEY